MKTKNLNHETASKISKSNTALHLPPRQISDKTQAKVFCIPKKDKNWWRNLGRLYKRAGFVFD